MLGFGATADGREKNHQAAAGAQDSPALPSGLNPERGNSLEIERNGLAIAVLYTIDLGKVAGCQANLYIAFSQTAPEME